MKKQKVILFFGVLLICSFGFAKGTPSIFDELNYQELVEVDLTFDMAALFADRKNSKKYKAVFSYPTKKGTRRTWDIKVAQRGKFRRRKCDNLPPLKLYFKKGDLKESGLATFDDYKLVTHCVLDFELAKTLLVKEYLAYKMYNQLTEESYRVQFLKINYQDIVSGKVMPQYAILIEDTAQVRARIGAEKKATVNYPIPIKVYDKQQVNCVSLFQYMIGNADWSIKSARNVKPLLRRDTFILIPYDFDFAGLVDAPYARLRDSLGIFSPQERVYLGLPEDVETLGSIAMLFERKKWKILRVIRRCKLLDRKNKKAMTLYIKSFYKNIEYISIPRKEYIH